MILRNVVLENFGLYVGTTEIDLVPRSRRGDACPIVLVGGKNGAGKTTFLEAVRLALYGRRALGARVAQSDYEAYLRGRINRHAGNMAAAVGLEFDYAEAGVVHRYRVRREWSVRGKSLVESLLLEKDGTTVTSVPREEWHHFLQELIPPGVSQLFFFDGEKISEIADGEAENEHLAEAMRGLLGIDLVGRLRADLGLYLARHLRDGDGASTAKLLEAVNREIAAAARRAEEIGDAVAELVSARDSQARQAERVRRQFVAEGGDVALHRARTEAERDEAKRGITRCEHELRDLSNKLLPFTLAPKLVGSFRAALAQANGPERQQGSLTLVRGLLVAWRADKSAQRQGKWDAKHWSDLQHFFDAQSRPHTQVQSHAAFREVGDGAAALGRLAEVELDVRPRARALLKELDALTAKARALDTALARADNAAAGVLLDELRLAEQKVGATEAALNSRQEELKLLRGQMVTLDRDRRRLEDEQAGSAKAMERSELAARTAKALADYEKRLLEHKLGQLRTEFVNCFNRLARKADLIADVRIDPETFATTLIDRGHGEIPKSALSAGEKQIYAIAMLWALARTSGRPLPMIIDTPLARLDSEHRAKLTGYYFPAASHQVILLSTDTEIDEALMRDLAPSVSHAFRLDYDHEAGRTVVSNGYFASGFAGRIHALQQA
ncbi:DNA sulfur modification protein DndD [Mesorhizobium loti]|uniref:DNA sulfur modification protein DndD n=1 Tax=Mesorhizobium TaxID=68287 RepID=UPI000BAFAC6C|nr:MULTISPECIES: DNA sulfur modification protein DndD [Mesorhizobium]PBB14190.1 DNA sulfur modification protein DndD [Mesorhizobium loti]PBC07334.1 DNA sulfur modification protein DndD [Mesorhizobium sp. WSM3859]